MIEIIQNHGRSILAAFALVVFSFVFAGCNVSDLPKRVQSRVESLEGDGSVTVKTPIGGNYVVVFKNARQEDGYFKADLLRLSGRGFEFFAENYKRPLTSRAE